MLMPKPSQDVIDRRADIVNALRAIVPGDGVITASELAAYTEKVSEQAQAQHAQYLNAINAVNEESAALEEQIKQLRGQMDAMAKKHQGEMGAAKKGHEDELGALKAQLQKAQQEAEAGPGLEAQIGTLQVST